jgi:DNA repair protein RecN (Recombination protein N)
MLKHLYIKNYTLIDELDITFSSGFSVITGETGAGKSIILGAIGLLLGQRADTKAIKNGADRCVVEAHFDLSRYDMGTFFADNDIDEDAADTIVRRELLASGKSRAFINDTPVSLGLMKELGEQLVDVHSQHQNLLLAKQDFQLEVVDIIAKDRKELDDYQNTYAQYQQAKHDLETLQQELEQGQRETDFLQFQFDELTAARLQEGEQEELEARSDQMTHAEDIKQALYEADNALNADDGNVLGMLKRSVSALRAIEKVLPQAQELANRMDSCYIELKDVAGDVSSELDDIDFDPSELEAVNDRLDRLYDLEKKYSVTTVDELIGVRDRLGARLGAIENSDEAMAELQAKTDQLAADCEQKAGVLTQKRQQAAKKTDDMLRQKLVPLGMPNVRFEIQMTQEQLGPNGHDRVAFLFSANTSTPMQPVSQVASGGEIARVMLSVKAMISGFVKLPTIIFDEIDTGVSGKIAEQMAQMMNEMGRQERQVISITHLPQIAALGTTHYKVYKEEGPQGTISHMQQLTADERVGEIAQMLSGSDVSEAAIENARQLLKNTKS